VSGGTVTSAAKIVANGTGASTVSAAITSANGLEKTNGGNLTLSGLNSGLKGVVTVTAGTITAGTSNALGSGAIVVQNNGVIDLSGFTQSTATGVSVDGSLRNGTITVNGGSIIVGAASASASVTDVAMTALMVSLKNGTVTNSVINSGTLDVGNTNIIRGSINSLTTLSGTSGIVGAVISGSGVVVRSEGNLTLAAYNGATLNGLDITGGTVTAGTYGAFGNGLVSVGSLATLDFGTYAPTASTSGVTTFTTLIANGTVKSVSDIVLGSTQTLKGSGRVNGTVSLNGGTISPGLSPGSLTVGKLTGTGTYIWEINTGALAAIKGVT